MSGYIWTNFGVLKDVKQEGQMVIITNEMGSTRKMSITKYGESAIAVGRRCYPLIGQSIDIQTSQNTAEWCTKEWFSDISPHSSLEKIENARGYYGQLFYTKDRETVCKVFLNRDKEGRARDIIEAVFNAEVDAYTKAAGNKNIENLLPKFYGCIDLTGKLHQEDDYYPDLAFEIEYIDGHFAGIRDTCISRESSNAVINIFRKAGIDVSDSSVTYSSDGKIIKVVDIKILV
ncbi:hypothetical protein [Aeromonas veronii]|uniref:hypothetical protein n=1 Tax=Aeromonas veronii TaxID=654 RepID=UPI003BA0E2E6